MPPAGIEPATHGLGRCGEPRGEKRFLTPLAFGHSRQCLFLASKGGVGRVGPGAELGEGHLAPLFSVEVIGKDAAGV